MVTITNGNRTTTVTRGAFKNYYEPNGWEITDSGQGTAQTKDLPGEAEKVPDTPSQEPELASEEETVPEEMDIPVEIPLSEMKIDELRQYAVDHDIDVSKAKSSREIRRIIKANMEE